MFSNPSMKTTIYQPCGFIRPGSKGQRMQEYSKDQEYESSPASVATLLHFPAVPASVLNPATAARKGGSVAASPVDLSEFGTADERE